MTAVDVIFLSSQRLRRIIKQEGKRREEGRRREFYYKTDISIIDGRDINI